MIVRNLWAGVSLAVLSLLLAGCGGGGGNAGTGTIVAPAPAPAPSPTPSPTPTPVPTPTPTPPPSGSFAGVQPGGYISGPSISGFGEVTGTIGSDGIAQLTGIVRLDRIAPGAINIQYLGADHYAVEPAGFGGPVFEPAEQRISPNALYDLAAEPLDNIQWGWALEIYTGMLAGRFDYLTFGSLSDPRASSNFVDFFVAGSRSASGPGAGIATYSGVVDGVIVTGGHARRLFGSSVTLRIDGTSRAVELALELSDRDGAFADFPAFPLARIGPASGSTTLDGVSIRTGQLAGPQGYSGTFWGNLFGPAGVEAGIAFELSTAAGDRIIGIVALKRS